LTLVDSEASLPNGPAADDLVLPARIGINAIFLEPRMGGLDTYVRALVPELVRLAPEVEFSVYCNPRGMDYLASEGWGDAVQLRTSRVLGVKGLKALSELTLLGAVAGRDVDLLHSVALTAPLRTRAVNIVTLADVTWIVAPERDEAATVALWRLIVPPVARRADRLIALSEAGAEHIVQYLRVPRERIDVVALASGGSDLLPPTPEGELRQRLGLGAGPVVLTVSAKKANKNLERLVRAMKFVAERWPDAVLVMPGNPTPHEQRLRALAAELGLSANVSFPDYVSAEDLEGLYALAGCFVFASINEGFGIPILEAMRHGVPVACANASALPEVAGDAAMYFDPYDVPDIGRALIELLANPGLRSELAARGRDRQSTFTWEAAAKGTLRSYSRGWREKRQAA
jgi:glycosyltransferase involved in cell wall biosynthesis